MIELQPNQFALLQPLFQTPAAFNPSLHMALMHSILQADYNELVLEAILERQRQQVNLLQPLIDFMLNKQFESEARERVAYALTHEYPKLPRIWHVRLSRAFCALLSDASELPSLRGQAGEGLAEIYELYTRSQGRTREYRNAGELLIKLLGDPVTEVRFWSCFALCKMRYRPALRALNDLADKDPATHGQWWSVGEEAADAIRFMKGRKMPDRVLRPSKM